MKVQAAASSTVVAFFLALSTYGVRLDTVIDRLIGGPADSPVALTSAAPDAVSSDYETKLSSYYMATDSVLQAAASPDPHTRLTLAVTDGQTLAGVLAMADIASGEATAAVEAARRIYDPRKLRAGQFVTVSFAANNGPFQGFELQADNDHIVTVARNNDGFSATQTQLAVRTETRVARGVIRNSLFDSAATAGIPNAVTTAIIHAFSYDVDFQRDIQPGDRFKVMFNTLVNDSATRPGDILYAELILSGKSHAIYGMRGSDGSLEFYTRDGKSVKKGLLKTPVDGARLTSGFGMRLHPILGFTRMHKGVDFGVPTGTPIYAAGDGVIEKSGWAGGYGQFVKIKHNTHTETAYGHMSRIASAATVGQHVHQGEVIGYVGMTGDATGPHLHYEVIKDGEQVNPISVMIPMNTGLEGNALVAFLKTANEREDRFAALIDGVQVASAHPR